MLLKVSLSSGETITIDLAVDFQAWERLQADRRFQTQIRSLSLVHDKRQHSLPSPNHFRRVSYMAEVMWNGEGKTPAAYRIGYQADEILAWLTVYFRSAMARYDVKRVGRPRHLPPGRSWPQRQE